MNRAKSELGARGLNNTNVLLDQIKLITIEPDLVRKFTKNVIITKYFIDKTVLNTLLKLCVLSSCMQDTLLTINKSIQNSFIFQNKIPCDNLPIDLHKICQLFSQYQLIIKEIAIDRCELNKICNDDNINIENSMKLITLYDSIRRISNDIRFVPYTLCKFDYVITQMTLTTPQKRIFEAGFFAPLSTIHRPITHILSKVINIRCQARKFWTVTMKYVHRNTIEAANLNKNLRQLFVCSLLGNYDHIKPSNRLQLNARSHAYKLYHGRHAKLWFEQMIKDCPLLVINALRDFVIFCIHANPSLHKRLKVLMHLDRLIAIVDENMFKIRNYFSQMLVLPTSALSITIDFGTIQVHEFKTIAHDINKLMSGSHASVLRISYRRPNLHMYQFLLSIRKKRSLIPLQNKFDHEKQNIDIPAICTG